MKLKDLPVFYQVWDDKTHTWGLIHYQSGDFIKTNRSLSWPYPDVPTIRHRSDLPVINIEND